MVQTRDKVAASLVVAAMVAFGIVVAPTGFDSKATANSDVNYEDAQVHFVGETNNVVADDYADIVKDADLAEAEDNGDGTETVYVVGNDSSTKVVDDKIDGIGDSVEVVIAPAGFVDSL